MSTPTPSRPTRTRRRRTATRVLAAVATLSVLPALLAGTPAAGSTSAAVSTTDPADAAAGWLSRQLSSDNLVEGPFGPDYGLTADVVLALDSTHIGRVTAHRATNALRKHVADYTGGGDPNEFYAGAFAKLLNVAVAEHSNVHGFGGGARFDLVGLLRYLECGNGQRPACAAADDGRFSDISVFGDFSNTITQSLAVLGLDRAVRSGTSRRSVVYLRDQQCNSGAFPLEISTPGCTPSVDATAFAVQALLEIGGKKATAAAMDGARWLNRHQNANGSFTGNDVPNTNTTGLAAQALLAAGHHAAATDAVTFVRSLQVGCAGKAENRGKVRYAKHAAGDPVRATAQAVPALAGVGLGDIRATDERRGQPTLSC